MEADRYFDPDKYKLKAYRDNLGHRFRVLIYGQYMVSVKSYKSHGKAYAAGKRYCKKFYKRGF